MRSDDDYHSKYEEANHNHDKNLDSAYKIIHAAKADDSDSKGAYENNNS